MEEDIQVNPDDVAVMERLVPTPLTGRVPDDVTHLLRIEEGSATVRTYKKQVRRPVDRDVLRLVSGSVAARVNGEVEAPRTPR